jgi:hypothetical protein
MTSQLRSPEFALADRTACVARSPFALTQSGRQRRAATSELFESRGVILPLGPRALAGRCHAARPFLFALVGQPRKHPTNRISKWQPSQEQS